MPDATLPSLHRSAPGAAGESGPTQAKQQRAESPLVRDFLQIFPRGGKEEGEEEEGRRGAGRGVPLSTFVEFVRLKLPPPWTDAVMRHASSATGASGFDRDTVVGPGSPSAGLLTLGAAKEPACVRSTVRILKVENVVPSSSSSIPVLRLQRDR